MTWTATYDPNTDIGAVRSLIFDVDLTTVPTAVNTPPRRTWSVIFADIEVQSAINHYSSNFDFPTYVYYAAAELCNVMATNKAFYEVRLKIGDYENDTKLSSKSLQTQASIYRALAESLPVELLTDVAWSDPNYARILYNRFLSGA